MSAPLETSGMGVAHTARSEWPYAIAALAACSLALGVIFREEFVGAYRVWVDSATYNHCFLIIPISLYMIWQRRDTVAAVSPKPDLRALLLIPLLSLVWLAASILGVLEARQFVVMTIVQAMLFGVLGWPVYRRSLAPFLYLYFLVPSGDYLVPDLQDFTANFAVAGLQLFGIPVYSDGTVIAVPAGEFAVAEACAGLRFLIASIAFGVFYATEIYQSLIRRTIFIGLSIVVPVIANGFRALGLIAAAEAFGSAAAVEADHVTYGWVFFSMVLIVLIFIGRAFSDKQWGQASETPPRARLGQAANPRALASVALLSIGLAIAGPALGAVLDFYPATLALRADAPSASQPWRPLAGGAPDWRPIVVSADREFSDSFTDGAERVDRFVALYARRGRTNNLIRSEDRIADLEVWNIAARRRVLAQIGGHGIQVNSVELISGTRRRLVWWFYALDGTTAATLWDAKRHQVHAYLTGSGCPSAFIAIAIDMTSGLDATTTLDRYLAAMEPPASYLCGGQGKTPQA